MAKHAALTYSDEINDKLIKWMNETGYTIVQINGQRISSSPRLDRKPTRGCEVFVGKIPRDCYEDELFPVFQRAGPIHELRLMMMFSGTNRGYAFVMYERQQDAQRAVHALDNYEIRRGHRIGVLPCVNNCRLFVGCFDAKEHGVEVRAEAHLQQVLRAETENVVSVMRRAGRNGRWYLLVEYSNHRAAAIARRELTPRRAQLFGSRVIVDWEIPLDKRGRKVALDQRRALKNYTMLNLYKPIGNPQFAEPELDLKSSHLSPISHPSRMLPSSCYQEQWLQNQLSYQEALSVPSNAVFQLNGLNELPQNSLEWYFNGPVLQKPQTGSDVGSNTKGGFYQDILCEAPETELRNSHSQVYRPLIPRGQHSLLRSTDSGVYSDPDCPRPLSSDSSTGSTGSSCSLSGRRQTSPTNWDCSTASSNSSGSVTRSLERSLSSVDSCYSDAGAKLLKEMEDKIPHCHSVSPSWQAEEQSPPYYSSNHNDKNVGIWNSCLQSPEDYELISNLFMKDDTLDSQNFPCKDIDLQLENLSLSNESKNHCFGPVVRPAKANYNASPKRVVYPAPFRKGF